MSTYTSEPGTRLAGRYRLEDQVDAGSGWALWKAIDEILARAVTVLMFAENFPRVREAVTAARAASRLNDSRLSQVFDVDDSGERAYIVMEWVAGESLADMLSDGPVDPAWAAALVAEAAQAISVAHAAGLAHLKLVPGSLRWTSGGGAKITGLGMDAAIAGAGSVEDGAEDPAVVDTRHLAWLMYAAVTGYWPGPQDTGLPPAPTTDGSVCSPRQVSAGVPASIDSIICQAMFQRPGRNGQLIRTPLDFADALAEVAAPAVPTPVPYEELEHNHRMAEASQTARYGSPPAGATQAVPWGATGPGHDRRGGRGGRGGHGGRRRSSGAARALIAVVVLVVLVAAAAVAWSLIHAASHNGNTKTGGGAASRHSSSARPSATAGAVLKPVGATAADNSGQAAAAIDGSPATDWHSQFYLNNPVFGGYRTGSGLIVDMGTQVKLSQLQVQFGPTCCAAVQIGIGNSDDPTTDSGFTTVASSPRATGTMKFSVSSPATGRYVMIWFTKLPPEPGNTGNYEAQVYDVVVRGSS
ncbi:MAG TPA: protein kinase family protein [Streptosporangiaceae bacterium]